MCGPDIYFIKSLFIILYNSVWSCVQDKMNSSAPHNQINGNSHEPPNAPSEQPAEQHTPTQTSSSNVSGQSQNSAPSNVTASAPVNSQKDVQKATKSIPSAYKKELDCMQCHVLFQDKPQVFQCKVRL